MSTYSYRRELSLRDRLPAIGAAAGAAAGVGLVVYYLGSILLGRARLEPDPRIPRADPDGRVTRLPPGEA